MITAVLIKKFCELTGYSDKAVRRKMESGVWLEGDIWRKAPDGHIMIDLVRYDAWARGTTPALRSDPAASGSFSIGADGAAGKRSDLSQPAPT